MMRNPVYISLISHFVFELSTDIYTEFSLRRLPKGNENFEKDKERVSVFFMVIWIS